jgi:threonine dehydrogenase-like Zn-dependent dehydrogenase
MAVRACVLKGAGRIFGVGSREVCFKVAKEYGASDLISYRDGDVVEQILKKNGGKVDAVIVCGGSDTGAIVDALKLTRAGGTVINVAAFMYDKALVIPNEVLYFGLSDVTFRGASCRGGRAFMERLLALVEYGHLQPERMVTHTFHGMDKIAESLEMMGGKDRTAIKPVVFFD